MIYLFYTTYKCILVIRTEIVRSKVGIIKGDSNSVGAKLRYIGYFASLFHPQEEKVDYYFQSGTCLGALETHVLLCFLWSIFCK